MNSTTPRRGDEAWFTRSTMARVFDCSPQSFDQYVRPHIPPEAVKKAGREVYFWGRRVIEAWAARNRVAEDPLLAGADSPALEVYRAEKAKIARLQRLEMEGKLVPMQELHNVLVMMGATLRHGIETAHRLPTVGEAVDRITEAINDFEKLITDITEENDPDDDPTPEGRAV